MKAEETLDTPVATVSSPGIKRVKPSGRLHAGANAISRMPAMVRNARAYGRGSIR